MTTPSYTCPTCGKAVRQGSAEFPFCRERCRLVDLGQWLQEGYRVSRPLYPQQEDNPLTAGEAEEDVSSGEAHED